MTICKTCGGEISEGATVCETCGTSINGSPTNNQNSPVQNSAPTYQAPTSFNQMNQQQTPQSFNQSFGGQMGTVPPGYQQKSRTTAGLLGIFFGSLGVGRFYLGYTGMGIAQLLVTIFTMGIGSLWGFIDGIIILTGNPKVDKKGVPLR